MWHAFGLSGNEKRYATPQRFRVLPGAALTGKVDPEARLAAVQPSIMTKGMYLADLMARLETRVIDEVWPTLQAPPRHGKYQPFLDYPFADALRWLHAVARTKYAAHGLLEGLRRLGRDTVKVFVASQAGQVVRSMTTGPRDALLRMPKMWKVTDPSHSVLASEPRPGLDRLRSDRHVGTSGAQPRRGARDRRRAVWTRDRGIQRSLPLIDAHTPHRAALASSREATPKKISRRRGAVRGALSRP